jgi:hypothetical protein
VGQARVYQDAILLDDIAESFLLDQVLNTYTDNAINIGRSVAEFIPFHGVIDEVRVYDRALSDTEIEELYDSLAQVPILGCSLWASRDTVSMGQGFNLCMIIDNIGDGQADDVVPHITLEGSGVVSLDSGPFPPYINIEPNQDTMFTWIYTAEDTSWVGWSGYASGINPHLECVVNSPEDTSNVVVIQTPAQMQVMAVIAGWDTVHWGQEDILVDIVVHNSGEADALVDSAGLKFMKNSAILDSEYTVTLLNPIDFLPGLSTDMLNFSVDVGWEATEGWVSIHSRIFGSDKNSSEPLFDTTAALADSFYVLGYACGDCNGDGNVTFADALYLKNYYYQTPPGSPAPIGQGDVNLDGNVTFADALYLKNYYFQPFPFPSPPPCEPF